MGDSSSLSVPPFDFAEGGRATPKPWNDSFNEPFQNFLGQAPSLTPDGFVQLAIDLEHAAEDWPSLWRPMRKLNNRFDQLWCTLVQELGEPEPFLARLSHTERAAMRLSLIVANFQAYRAEVLGNPLIRPKCLLELLKTRPVYVKPVEEWACSQIPYRVEDRLSAEVRRSSVYLKSLENKHVTLMGNLDYHLLRKARKPQEKSDGQQDPSLAVELPKTFEEFLAMVEAASGEVRTPAWTPAFAGVTEPEGKTRPEGETRPEEETRPEPSRPSTPPGRCPTTSFPRRRESTSLLPTPPASPCLRRRSAT